MADDKQSIPVPAALLPLIAAIRRRVNPREIWLFGSRARGDCRPDSDWDIMITLDDERVDEALDPLLGWNLQREVGIPATIVATTSTAFAESWGVPNTLGYVLAREGLRLSV